MAVTYVAVTASLIISGVFGNCCILYVTKKQSSLNHTGKTFIINMALADLCVSGIANPMCIVGAVMGRKTLDDLYLLCNIIACFCLTTCICVFLNLTCLTVNRYIFICQNNLYHKIFSSLFTKSICILCWVVAFVLEVPNMLGWGGHTFDTKSHQCIWDRTANRSYTLFVSLGLITCPLISMSVFHMLIFQKIWKAKDNLIKNNLACQDTRATFSRAVSSSKILITMFIIFLVCWTPYAVVIALDHSDAFSMETHLFVTLIAHAHSCTNFYVYLVLKKSFRSQCFAFCRKIKIVPISEERKEPPTPHSKMATSVITLPLRSPILR